MRVFIHCYAFAIVLHIRLEWAFVWQTENVFKTENCVKFNLNFWFSYFLVCLFLINIRIGHNNELFFYLPNDFEQDNNNRQAGRQTNGWPDQAIAVSWTNEWSDVKYGELHEDDLWMARCL